MNESFEANSEHEWISEFQNFDFEAVLVCQNELGPWDSGACFRAYQTFHWRDASTPPNHDLSFSHTDTGALVQHDGGVVGIHTLQSTPVDSLRDLFLVLHALGWRDVVVHHPSQTIELLLRDIGKAIPASMMDFDVRKAEIKKSKISDFPESKDLVLKGMEVLRSASEHNRLDASDGAYEMIMGEMNSMGQEISSTENQSEKLNGNIPPFVNANPLFLDDDLEEERRNSTESVEHSYVRSPAGWFNPMAKKTDFGPSLKEDGRLNEVPKEEPLNSESAAGVDKSALLLKKIVEADELRSQLTQVKNELMEKIEAQTLLHKQVEEAKWDAANSRRENNDLMERISDLQQEIDELNLKEEKAGEQGLKDNSLKENLMSQVEDLRSQLDSAHEREENYQILEKEKQNSAFSSSVVKIGDCALCFDLPDAPFSDENVEKVRVEFGYQVERVVSLNIGAISETVRWDIFGEISHEHPWEAEKLACAMGFSEENRALVSSIFIDMKTKVKKAQLRDLLRICESSGFDAKVRFDKILSEELSNDSNLLFSRLLSADLQKFLSEVFLRIGPLLLCDEGSAFIDVRKDDVLLGAPEYEIFTVRSLLDLESDAAKIFVVHVDSLDGPFVKNTAELLRQVAISYGSTKRYELASKNNVPEPENDSDAGSDAENNLAQEKLKTELKETLVEILKKLELLGISA